MVQLLVITVIVLVQKTRLKYYTKKKCMNTALSIPSYLIRLQRAWYGSACIKCSCVAFYDTPLCMTRRFELKNALRMLHLTIIKLEINSREWSSQEIIFKYTILKYYFFSENILINYRWWPHTSIVTLNACCPLRDG